MSEQQTDSNQVELPNKDTQANAGKGFKKVKKATKKDIQNENNALRKTLQNLQQANQFLGQQLFQMMNTLKGVQEQSQAAANLLRYDVVEGEVKNGDSVLLDFSGVMADTGKTFDGSFMLGSMLHLGRGNFLKDFEAQVEGMKVGEQKQIKIKFPEDYNDALKGKEAIFDIKIISAYRPKAGDDAIQKLHEDKLKTEAEANRQEEKVEEKDSDKQ